MAMDGRAGGGEAERSHAVVIRQMTPKVAPPARVRIFHRHQADGFVQQVLTHT